MNVATADTKEQILNVAEKLFAEKGFAGTTLRGVIREAEVNIAAVHYHFGSKEKLFSAVVQRVAKQIIQAQQRQLKNYENGEKPTSVENLLEAFIAPPLQTISQMGEMGVIRAQFIGRCRTEPFPVQQLAEKEFSENHQRFLDMLQRALPDQTRSELQWKLDLSIAVLVRVLTQVGKPNALVQENSPQEVEVAIKRLVNFVTQGMKA
ncbi:TetR/AcrR family transcriptional regulator [Mastigocoleus testarum]|uniref:TetR/AcrR family transcriptional regulator n=1 Tax=Mastigocoleus testarum TaxID=996925 RepID=UPI00041759F0|nr:TetR/AcrR family transcriptional regulator [Mastigocoleus testarum]